MGTVTIPPRAVLTAGIMARNRTELNAAEERLAAGWGPVALSGDIYSFSFSSYYTEEMGSGLIKKFVSMHPLIRKDELAEIKVATNAMENEYAETLQGKCRRRINVDPGYLDLSKLVLATTKDYGHRIYIGQGIYAEVTLRYKRLAKGFTPMEWTYADYRTERALAFFNRVRERYRARPEAGAGGRHR